MAGRILWTVALKATQWQLIRIHQTRAEVVACDSCDPFVPQDVAQGVIDALRKSGHHSRQPVMLALGSTHCVAATIELPSARHVRNREAMSYLLEPLISWPAEDCVVDFERTETQALMVATRCAPLLEMLPMWADAGIRLASITILARLHLQSHLKRSQFRVGRHVVLSESDGSVEMWLLDGRQPIGWRHLESTESAVLAAVKLLLLSETPQLPVECSGLRTEMTAALCQIAELDVCVYDDAAEECSPVDAFTVRRILDGRDFAPLELLREPLSLSQRSMATQRMSELLLASLMLLMICGGVALLFRAQQENSRREEIVEQQRNVFREVLPDQRMQQAVRTRLESELRHLRGIRGHGDDLVTQSVAAVSILGCVLSAFDDDLRFRILEIRIEKGRLHLVGEVREHSDADTIASALRNAGMVVASPQTHRLADRGVGFRISAEIAETMAAKEPT